MTEEEKKLEKDNLDAEAKRLFERFRSELVEIRMKNQELYDQNLLTLSSAGLGLSITFIKDIVQSISNRPLLIFSWIFLGLAIISTLFSLAVGPLVADKRIEIADEYYLQRKPDAWAKDKKYWPNRMLHWINWLSGGLFVCTDLVIT